MATTTLVAIARANCVSCTSRRLARYREERQSRMAPKIDLPDKVLRDNIQGITKPAIRRLARRGEVSFGSHRTWLHLTRGPREVLLTQFARPMETKVVVAITWLPVGIELFHKNFLW